MTIAIMQPYFFPYIGYYQLVNAVNTYVFYDDVNFINRGWINRNRILINGQASYITIPLKDASQNKLINEIELAEGHIKVLKSVEMAYKKAPYFSQVFPLVSKCISDNNNQVGNLARQSITTVFSYLGIEKHFLSSSKDFPETKGLERAERLVAICCKTAISHYINASGGKELYNKADFEHRGIKLNFIKPAITEYKQFNNSFVPGLSMIDVLMFNAPEQVIQQLNNYELE